MENPASESILRVYDRLNSPLKELVLDLAADDAALLRRSTPAHRGRVRRIVSRDGSGVLACGVHVQRIQHRRSATRLTERRTNFPSPGIVAPEAINMGIW